MNQNVDPAEIAKFEALAARWWDLDSEFKPLHAINPLRIGWIDERAHLHGKKVIIILLVLTYFKSCGIDSELTKVKKELKLEQTQVNEIKTLIEILPTSKDMQIEGLKSEKRMIQGTDRKMLDVQRQNEIERLIDELEN